MTKQKIPLPTIADIEARGVPPVIAEQALALLRGSDPVALAIEVALHRHVRRHKGRAPFEARTPDGELIASVMQATGLTLAEIARVLGADRSVLSRANDPSRTIGVTGGLALLSEERRKQLSRMRDAFGGMS